MRTSSVRVARPRHARGFTLIELVVTFTLFGILIALGLPSFMSWIRNNQIRTVAESLQTGVKLAQTEAVRLNQQVVLSFTNASPVVNAAAVANGKNWSVQTVPQFGKAAVFVHGGALTDVAPSVAIGGGVTAICLNSNGRLVDNPAPGVPGASCNAGRQIFPIAQASPTASDRPLNVTVSVAGQVRMCDPNLPALSATSPAGC